MVTAGNSIDVLVDGNVTATATSPETGWMPQIIRVPVADGLHALTFRSRQPGIHPPNDGRTLAFGIKNLDFKLE